MAMGHEPTTSITAAHPQSKRVVLGLLADLWAVIVWIYIVLATVVLGLSGIVSLVVDRRARFLHWLAWIWGRSIIWFSRVRLESEGNEHLDLDHPKILMANHQSQFDIWAILAQVPRKIRFVAKKELCRVPVLGQALKGGGHVIVDRKNRRQAFASYDKAAEKIRAGTSIIIFAEGTRSPDGRLLPFKKGGFMLALSAGVPIIPVSIVGGSQIMPAQSWRIRPGTMRLVFHEPIDPRLYSVKTRDKLMAAVRDAIASSLDQPATPSRRP